MEEQFPSNSQQPPKKATEPRPKEKKRVEKVIEGEVVRRKKPLGKRFKELFAPQDTKSAGEYILLDILVPGAKDIVVDAGQSFLERIFYGEVRSHTRRGHHRVPSSSGRTDYRGISSSSRPAYREEPRHTLSRRAKATHDFDEILFDNRFEAEEVLDNLYHLLERYEVTSVADLYDLVGISWSYPDDKWGWYDLRGAGVSHTRAGYLLDLPRPEPID